MSYRTFTSLKQHIITKHPSSQLQRMTSSEVDTAWNHSVGYNSCLQSEEDQQPTVSFEKESKSEIGVTCNLESIKEFAAVSLCRLKADVSLTDKTIKQVINFSESLVGQINDFVRQKLTAFLNRYASFIPAEQIVKLQNSLCFDNIFKDVKTSTKQQSFLNTLVGTFPKPRSIMLKGRKVKRFVNGKEQLTKVYDTFQYIPIVESLKMILRNPENRLALNENEPPNEQLSIHQSFIDGKQFKNNTKYHGYNKILAPLVEDLKKLEKGIQVYIGKENITIRAAVIVVAGDTLAVHELLGLLGPSASFFCRECTITRNEFLKEPFNNIYQIRDRSWCEKNLQELQKKDILSKDCGLKSTGCILNDLQQFHLTNNHFFDVMHDLAEGVIPVTLQLVLAHYYREKILGFTIEFINHRLQTFNYGYRDRKNKPVANITAPMLLLPTKHKMRQTASQYLLLLRAFPFLFRQKIPDGCEYLDLISVLINITRISFSPTVSNYHLAELEMNIKIFCNMFCKLFSCRPNKLHHLYHYPECIKEIGPLEQYDCRIFEQKNKAIKNQMNVARNYKNVCYSLAKRQIFAQALAIAEKPFKDNISYQSGKIKLVKDTLSAPLLHYNLEDRCFCPKEIIYNGIRFRPNSVISMKTKNQNGIPSYGEIKEIIVINDVIRLLVTSWETIDFDDILQAYLVESENVQLLLELSKIHSHTTFSFWKKYNDKAHYTEIKYRPTEKKIIKKQRDAQAKQKITSTEPAHPETYEEYENIQFEDEISLELDQEFNIDLVLQQTPEGLSIIESLKENQPIDCKLTRLITKVLCDYLIKRCG
uniref:C2H2-type domain-containing protein n=1 Tax=Anopheles dirus TaxID=7168 RepID=A0A182NSV2_9DIPT